MYQAAVELHRANWTPSIDINRTSEILAPYMNNCEIITEENMPDSWKTVLAGTEVSDEVYYQMLNVMRPIGLRKSQYCGFQVGEPYDHREDSNGKWRPRFMTFVKIGSRFYYAGINFGGECNWRKEE